MPTLAGTRLDKYDMLEEVGHGGMAIVYRGHDRVLQREVAVKVLHAHLADRKESRLRLQREALAVAKLRHDNILEIYDYSGPEADESYLVTEFIHGPTLKEWLERSPDPRPAVAAMIVHRLCLALFHAHRSAIVHRDIKPENVMIRSADGCVKLMDFGIAQLIDNQKLTLTGQLIGSPAYMAPELISGRPLDARTDLFSLGVLLYQLATGKLPFSGRNPHEVLNRIADGDYPAPSTVCPLVDRDLEDIVAKALAVNPDDRYQSAETFAKDLENYLLEMGIEPSQQELAAYFADPETYVEELDIRVGHALVEQAQRAAADGHTARAIRLLGRVLEIDPEHRRARDMLDRMRTRERRVRQFLIGAGALAVTGMLGAGALLLPSEEPESLELVAEDSRPAEAVRPTLDPSVPVAPPPREAIPAATDPSEVGVPGDAKRDDAKGDATPERASPPRRTRRVTRTPPPTHECVVRFQGIPASTARYLQVRVGKDVHDLTGSELMVAFQGPQTTIRLDDGGWKASRTLSAGECRDGAAIDISVPPPPAEVEFVGAPVHTVVICTRGCDKSDLNRNREPDKLRPIPVPNGTSQSVAFVFKAPGFLPSDTVRATVYPGKINEVMVDLQPLPQ